MLQQERPPRLLARIRRPLAALFCQFVFQRNLIMIIRVGSVALVATAFARLAMDMLAPLLRSVEAELPILSLAMGRNGMNMREFLGMLEKITWTLFCLLQ